MVNSAIEPPRNVLYLSYTGMLEPLGRSQVLTYLSCLSDDYKFTLVSFEKPTDMANDYAVTAVRAECERYGIDWRPQTYHKSPRLLATGWDLSVLVWRAYQYSAARNVALVHCRGYVPAIAAWLCAKITRKPFVFDMRAIWPDEMVTAGRLDDRSFLYRVLKRVERRLLLNAAKVVSLTEAGVDYLLDQYPEVSREKFAVITTCVDVSRFHVPERLCLHARLKDRQSFVVGTIGTLLSGWFYLDDFFSFFKSLKTLRPDARARIVTRDDHSEILKCATSRGVDPEDVDLQSAAVEEMPELLASMDVGVMFYAPDVGRAPTRLGEFLAAGVPVVGNTGIGDLGRLIRTFEIGVAIDDAHDTLALRLAAGELLDRYDGILASGACRHAAESYFSVEQGAEKYKQIYKSVVLSNLFH